MRILTWLRDSISAQPAKRIEDDEWFELQFKPEEARKRYGIILPTLPSDDVQVGFTALCGRLNLQQAFSFYRHVLSVCQLNQIRKPRILDFGGGWGRIARFFLRETKPRRIYIADTMSNAIDCLRATGNPCRVIHNEPRPPIPGLPNNLDLVLAYSVFSHLSEEYFVAWVNYLLKVLRPGGHLAFTTRGQFFINHLEHLHQSRQQSHDMLQEHHRRLREEMRPPAEIRRRYENGEFQFYPIGGAGELTSDFFGEAFIPQRYLEQNFGSLLVDFNGEVPYVDQSIVVLRKPKH
jgi:2-polyprenyl-3-methyl-5-hydroxy-6-metoxy-1,4-benzoquinol methylase